MLNKVAYVFVTYSTSKKKEACYNLAMSVPDNTRKKVE